LTMIIGNVSPPLGSKAIGALEIARTSAGQSVAIPFVIVNGREHGPTLVVNAAMHGTEIIGTVAISRLYKECDPVKVRGRLVGVPILSVWAFEVENRLPTTFDHFDIEQLFPGDPNGSITSRVAFAFTNEIASKADFLIDMHGQDQYWQPTRAAIVPKPETIDSKIYGECVKLAKSFGVDQIWRLSKPGNIAEVMIRERGIPAISTEFGGVTDFMRTEAYIKEAISGIKKVMRSLDMLDEAEQENDLPPPPSVLDLNTIYNRNGGMWSTDARVLDRVRKGDRLGTICDPITAETIEEVRAPMNGVLALVWCPPMIKPSSVAIGLGEVVG
jgi:uncharacterized protein